MPRRSIGNFRAVLWVKNFSSAKKTKYHIVLSFLQIRWKNRATRRRIAAIERAATIQHANVHLIIQKLQASALCVSFSFFSDWNRHYFFSFFLFIAKKSCNPSNCASGICVNNLCITKSHLIFLITIDCVGLVVYIISNISNYIIIKKFYIKSKWPRRFLSPPEQLNTMRGQENVAQSASLMYGEEFSP